MFNSPLTQMGNIGFFVNSVRPGQRQTGKVENLRIQHVRRADVGQGAEHDLPPSGAVSFPAVEDLLHLLALQTESFDWLVGNEAWRDRLAEAQSNVLPG